MQQIDAATLRKLAVASESDPRSVRRVLAGEEVRGLAGHRVRRVLVEAGLLPATATASTENP